MKDLSNREHVEKMYVKNDTLSTRIALHDKYSVNKYGWFNWVFDQYVLKDGMRVLELACGNAKTWVGREERLPKDIDIILSDFSPRMVETARAALPDARFSFAEIDIQDIPHPDAAFDAVIANHMLYHVPDMDKALLEVKRVLKPGGVFYATTLGEDSLNELNAIYKELGETTKRREIPFTLENGSARLETFFDEVDRREYIDALEVTEANDLIAYICSFNDIPDAFHDKLDAVVRAGFSADGVFHITKTQGMFMARR